MGKVAIGSHAAYLKAVERWGSQAAVWIGKDGGRNIGRMWSTYGWKRYQVKGTGKTWKRAFEDADRREGKPKGGADGTT